MLDCLDLVKERSIKYCSLCGYDKRVFRGFRFGHFLGKERSADGPRIHGLLLIALRGAIDHFSRVEIEVRFLIVET